MFIKDCKRILSISYTAMAFYALAFVTVAPNLIYMGLGIDTNPVVWGRLQIIIIILGLFGRLVDQPEANKWKRRGIVGGLLLIMFAFSAPALAHDDCGGDFDEQAFEFISGWEGKKNHAYLDLIGKPTQCYGTTRGVKIGDYKTDAECKALLISEIAEYREGLHRSFNEKTLSYRLTTARDVAYTSLAYNIGINGAGGSTAVRRLNNGDIRGGCVAIGWWNRAGNRVVRGLVNRRAAEVELCMVGIS